MAVLEEKSRIERMRKQNSGALEDIVDLFFEKESEASNLMDTSWVSASIVISEQNESSSNVRFNKPKTIPTIDSSLNSSNKKSESSLKKRNKPTDYQINKIIIKDTALDELGIRNKFITLKDKFSKPPSRSGSIGIRSPKFDSNSSQASQKLGKKPFVKSKSSSQKSNLLITSL